MFVTARPEWATAGGAFLTPVHALPRLTDEELMQRAALERLDAHDGSWRVYVATLTALLAATTALVSLNAVAYPLLSAMRVVQLYDVIGAAATCALVASAILALVSHHRATHVSGVARACAVLAWLSLMIGAPMLLLIVGVARFGLSA